MDAQGAVSLLQGARGLGQRLGGVAQATGDFDAQLRDAKMGLPALPGQTTN